MSTQRLELTWIGKNHPDYDIANIEPRILIEDPEKSYWDPSSENMLIHGDNLLALKALLPEYEGKIKCIYIDPPYNTGNAFEHYDDSVEHSTWLSLMKPRLELLRALLSEDWSIWISIDSTESHYLKVICDEIFWRRNFVDEIIWQRAFAPVNLKKTLSRSHDIILVYWKNVWTNFEFNKLVRSSSQLDTYKNPDNDSRGVWTSADCTVWPVVAEKLYPINTPTWRAVLPPDWRCWLFTQKRFQEMLDDNRIWFWEKWNNMPRVKKFLSEVRDWVVSMTLWLRDDVWDNQEAKKEVKAFNSDNVFWTPKPERLIDRVINLGSNPWDIVLDSFLGSWTTSAVAHKMGRKWIGIEMGDHAYTHCKVRLDKVIDNEDQWGITKSVNWKWGGGYKFYELAPSFITTDEYGNRVIDEYYNDEKLVRAMCKLLGYTFRPSSEDYFRHGVGTGQNYIYITTQMMNSALVRQIASHLWVNESLVIATKKYEPGTESVDPRITIKKIPQSVLKACQYGKKEYLLPIRESAIEEIEDEDDEEEMAS